VRVAGTRHDIVTCAKKYAIDTIIFAIPSMSKNERREILEICSQTGCELKTMPSIDDAILNDKYTSVTDVKIEDLLERVPIKLDMNEKMVKDIEKSISEFKDTLGEDTVITLTKVRKDML
jgi:FlaA1/EpsC-like NDP-sugar epimerase